MVENSAPKHWTQVQYRYGFRQVRWKFHPVPQVLLTSLPWSLPVYLALTYLKVMLVSFIHPSNKSQKKTVIMSHKAQLEYDITIIVIQFSVTSQYHIYQWKGLPNSLWISSKDNCVYICIKLKGLLNSLWISLNLFENQWLVIFSHNLRWFIFILEVRCLFLFVEAVFEFCQPSLFWNLNFLCFLV